MFAVLTQAVCVFQRPLYASAAAFLTTAHAQHPETQCSALRGLYQSGGHLMVLHRDPVHLHDIISSSETTTTRRGAGGAILHQQGAVSHYSESKATIGAWSDIHLQTVSEMQQILPLDIDRNRIYNCICTFMPFILIVRYYLHVH